MKNKSLTMKRAIVIGASSGIGREIAAGLVRRGWKVGIAARRTELLENLAREFPGAGVEVQTLDITEDGSVQCLESLVERLGGMDLFINVSGRGNQNKALEPEIELRTAELNVAGFIRMMDFAFGWFGRNLRPGGCGQIAAVTSIAGTKGMGTAPAYSATKRMQSTYIDALAQLARMRHISIDFTDIRPGFVRTDILDSKKSYPMLMDKVPVGEAAVNAILRRRRVVVIDWRFRILTFFWRLIPQWLWERCTGVTN